MQEVEQYLPHRQPMILVDELIEVGDDYAVSKFRVKEDGLFVTENGLPAWVIIEIFAQTTGLFSGAINKKNNEEPRVGFLLGSRKLEVSADFFPMHSTIITTVKQLFLDENFLGQFECIAECGDIQASARLNVYAPTRIPPNMLE